jgi:holo-[acyl-carrier protein] synthase
MIGTAGVGVDLVEVDRIERMIAERGAHVFERLLTSAERAYCESMARPAEHVAARLAAKEAVYKALQGTPEARGIGWREIEVARRDDGRPDVELSGRAAARARELGVTRVLLSLSHTHRTAIAMAVLSVGPPGVGRG